MKKRRLTAVLTIIAITGLSIPVAAEPPEHPQSEAREQRRQDEQRKHDEENRRRAEEARQAELAADQRVRDAGGIVSVKLSPECWSGEGKDFSQWYLLRSDPTPAGYYISEVIFRLVGDRQCGAWAECAEHERTADHVTWRFTMQGHDENKSLEIRSFFIDFVKPDNAPGQVGFPKIDVRLVGRKATSVGVLKVRYLPVG